MDYLNTTLLVVIALILVIGLLIRERLNYWVKRKIPNVPGTRSIMQKKYHFAYLIQDIYREYKNSGHPFVGISSLFMPFALLLDLDLIKNVFVSDFDSFTNRGIYHNVADDPLSGNIFRLEGEDWKRLRTKLTPTFTSGKMKFMFPTVVSVAERLVNALQEAEQGQSAEGVEMRDLSARFTTDVIGLVAFGIDCNSLQDPTTEFRVMGDQVLTKFNPFVDILGRKCEKLFNKLHIRAFSKEMNNFYAKIVNSNIEYREKNNIRRKDFMDILIDLKNNGGEMKVTTSEIISQSFAFFVAGFDTSSITITYCLYELCKNEDIQDKARTEIEECLKKYNNEFTFDCMSEMHYLKQIILETLRKYPVGHTIRRVASRNYRVPNTSLIIEKGTMVLIPVYSIHNDPELYPNPEVFNPDRFTPHEVQKRHPVADLSFGAGPRSCIAERFGKMQTTIGLALILKNFKLIPSKRTPKHLEFNPKIKRILTVEGGIHMRLEKIEA